MDELQVQYNALLAEAEILRKENSEMKALLFEHGLTYVPKTSAQKASIVSLYSPISFPPVNLGVEQRIELFRSLFRGREDVFARRWYNKNTEKGGYQPVCINEWRRGVCDRKTFKCAECPNRNFAPLGYQDLYRHLEGKDEHGSDVIGLYAIMPDNCCAFLCTDFDDKSCEHGYKRGH